MVICLPTYFFRGVGIGASHLSHFCLGVHSEIILTSADSKVSLTCNGFLPPEGKVLDLPVRTLRTN